MVWKIALGVCAGILLAVVVVVVAASVLAGAERAASRDAALEVARASSARSRQQTLERARETTAQLACQAAVERELAPRGAVDVDIFSLSLVSHPTQGPLVEGKASVTPAGGRRQAVKFTCRMQVEGDRPTVAGVSASE